MKRCSKCQCLKEINYFYKNRSMKDGLEAWCMECSKEKNKNWYSKNKDKKVVDKDKKRIYNKQYILKNKDKIVVQKKYIINLF